MSVATVARRIGKEDFRVLVPTYETILSVLGTSGALLQLWDAVTPITATAFTSKGRVALAHSFASAPSGWGTAPAFANVVPIVTMAAAAAEKAEGDADDAFWSPGSGVADSAFSVGAWVNAVDSAAIRTIMAKWDSGASAEREFRFAIDASDNLEVRFADQSAGVEVTRVSDAAIAQAEWAFLVFTYDGTGGATAMNGVTLYQNGGVIASTATNNAGYVAMEDLTQALMVGCDRAAGVVGNAFNGDMAGGLLGPFFVQAELTAADVRLLYDIGRKALDL